MGKKVPWTPASKITAALRHLSMRSRERAAALKLADRRCAVCGVKASVAKGKVVKVDAHHLKAPDWARVHNVIREELLQFPADYLVLCKAHHAEKHLPGKVVKKARKKRG